MAPVIFARVEDRLDFFVESQRAQVEVDETRSGDLDLLDPVGGGKPLNDGSGDVARVAACGSRIATLDAK